MGRKENQIYIENNAIAAAPMTKHHNLPFFNEHRQTDGPTGTQTDTQNKTT
eukprot:m.218729 g.218729  ORF g.218729 m.218729 type:complete len:51 (-) comp16994_c4_seq1:2233-2385(-)